MLYCSEKVFCVIVCLVAVITHSLTLKSEEEKKAADFIKQVNKRKLKIRQQSKLASWQYETNITEHTTKHMLDVKSKIANLARKDWIAMKKFNWKALKDEKLRRQFKLISTIGEYALPKAKFDKISKIISTMERTYSTAKICDYDNPSDCSLSLEPEIINTFATSRDAEELKHYWIEWRRAVGPNIKNIYKDYVDLLNEAAVLNNFTNAKEQAMQDYEVEDLGHELKRLWHQVKPLYLQLHAYVRYKLRDLYEDLVPEKGPIPAHLLGNVWSQLWNNVYDLTMPYPNSEGVSVTKKMQEQGYTPEKMFELANDFFTSMNMSAMPKSFWKNSVISKPPDGRELVCHPSAWDFYQKDVRIKMCTQVNEEYFKIVHHEMGHCEYYLQYAHQPVINRGGANTGFHEAVGDVISLSVSTQKHLHKIGLLDEAPLNHEATINNLFKISLEKVAFLPFAYLMDLWRWDVFTGEVDKHHWNCKWWHYRHEYQGVEPPVHRFEEDFDPGSKFHIAADVPYIRYFIAVIIEFQFHKALCLKAGQYEPGNSKKPLFNCDIYKSAAAGNALKKMLAMGRSKPWPEAMKVLTGQSEMDASGLLEYFKPLHDWLQKENKKNKVFVGWQQSEKKCFSKKGGAVKSRKEKGNKRKGKRPNSRKNNRKKRAKLVLHTVYLKT